VDDQKYKSIIPAKDGIA